jgi:hypothetical protein
MRGRPLLAAAAVVAVVAAIPATLVAGPITGADRQNASRACSALRAATGAKLFAQTFGTSRANAFGKCVATFAHTANAARAAAKTTCQGNAAPKRCMNAAVTAALNQQVTAMKNAAKTCAALRTSMGAAAFARKFGTNGNARNAFGKCVSSQARSKPKPGGDNGTQVFHAQLAPLNGSGVSGTAVLRLKGTTLTVQLEVRGLEANQSQLAHIHGLTTGDATCPTAAADTNGDKLISFQEGLPFYGPVLVELASEQVGANGRLNVTKTITTNVQSLLPLDTRTIVVHGLTVNGTYVPSLPVACGQVTG